jgi:predicted translin family RNA/ssDNA-binding protein
MCFSNFSKINVILIMSLSMSELKQVKKRYERLEISRRELQKLSADAQRLAKQAIFSLQRGDESEGLSRLEEALAMLKKAQKISQTEQRLAGEGMWRSALEEAAEAVLFFRLISDRDIAVGTLFDDPSIVLGGLSDAIGELVRLAVRFATTGDIARVEAISDQAEELVEFITSLDLTGSLRAKGDQARSHLRRLEDIRYDISRRV